jgi:glycosyltransferase involved in cell wall biosynthesis
MDPEAHSANGRPMNVPDVSVVVRSMARPTLARTLASIAAQDGVSLEAIVVAAAGTAHPPPPAHAGPHPVRFVASETPLPRAAAANAGLDAARGRYVTWLDDDDEWLPGHLRALLAAAAAHAEAGVVHSLAEVRVAGEPPRVFGQPVALSELYVRNGVHPSSALVDRGLVAAGCRCDEALPMHEDWDWLLQCAHRTRFHFVRQRSFVWYADIGDSGAGGGRNLDRRRVDAGAQALRHKWAVPRERLAAALAPTLARAGAACERHDWADAAEAIRAALALDRNNPEALALLSRVQFAQGDADGAQANAALASLVRPDDATLVYNLALICRARGDAAKVHDLAARLRRLVPVDPRAAALAAQIEESR